MKASPEDNLIRPARVDEAPLLSELALRSKAHWGYSPEFLQACRAELSYGEEQLLSERMRFFVMESARRIVGFYALVRQSRTEYELDALFVEPAFIGKGIGRLLFQHAKSVASAMGGTKLIIQGDPNAERFYIAMGGVLTGSKESGSIPGRFLPIYSVEIGRDHLHKMPSRAAPLTADLEDDKERGHHRSMKVVEKPALTIIGIPVRATWKELWVEMPKAWKQFISRHEEIPHASGATFVDVSLAKVEDVYHQVIGRAVSRVEQIPNGMTAIEIPAQTLIYHRHVGATKDIAASFGAMYEWASGQGLDAGAFKLDEGYTASGEERAHDLYIGLTPEKPVREI